MMAIRPPRAIAQKILESHAKNRSNSQTEVKLLFDTERDRTE
ncbi:MAG: hypothetical protein RM021_025075 [Nostoc sp. EkiNYC01]|nr:hypothetical protein [Nostoc sp. EkiNYC01]